MFPASPPRRPKTVPGSTSLRYLATFYSLEVVLHRTKFSYHSYGIGFASCLLYQRILLKSVLIEGIGHIETYIEPHEHVMLLKDGISLYIFHKVSIFTFSSPIVYLPSVTLLLAAYACRFLIGSLWRTEMANLALDFVYSWPVYIRQWYFLGTFSQREYT